MSHIMGLTYVTTNGRVFAVDESGSLNGVSIQINAISGPVSVGQLIVPDFRIYVGTTDGKVALFENSLGGGVGGPPQLFQVTNQIILSLYHASGVVYVGTGPLSPGPFSLIALDDRTFGRLWDVSPTSWVVNPAGVGYEGNVPKEVVFSSVNSSSLNASLLAVDVATGAELWSVSEEAVFGQRVHEGVVYYANTGGNSLNARLASDGTTAVEL
jgi:outer membrane protein assembly factor BamB